MYTCIIVLFCECWIISDFSVNEYRLRTWLGHQEDNNRIVIYEADPRLTPWTARCIRQVNSLIRLYCTAFPSVILGSIVVSISACHAEDPGSIPGRGVLFTIFFLFLSLFLLFLYTCFPTSFRQTAFFLWDLLKRDLQLPWDK